MFYLYLGQNKLKALYLKRSFLGQYSTAYFERTHRISLKADGTIKSIDLIASAVKEALTALAQKKENQVTLILPLESFRFLKIEIPKDINETALTSFIEDKIRSDLSLDPESFRYQYLSFRKETTTIINLYLIENSLLQHYLKIFDLLAIKLVNVVPETVSYYKLFEKTLRTAKQENIFYLRIENHQLRGFLFDSFGLVNEKTWLVDDYKKEDLEKILKEKISQFNEKGIKIDRLVLSGNQSEKIRQDTFTKNVGAWTNLLKRIIPDFYQNYLKLLVTKNSSLFSFLSFDQSFGAFIFEKENPNFKIKANTIKTKPRLLAKRKQFPYKNIFLFILSFVVSFGFLYLVSSHKFILPQQVSVSPTTILPLPTKTPSPTPKIERKKVKIEVLNGSGTKGQAAKMKKILIDIGYQEVVTKNADNFDYQKTIIETSKENLYIAHRVKEDLKDKLKDIQIKTGQPEMADIILTIGKDFE